MEIRALTRDDFDRCQRIFDESWSDLHRKYRLEEEPASDEEWLSPILEHFIQTDPGGLVAVTEGADPVAFAARIRRDDYRFLSFMFVRPDSQGRGIGRALLDELMSNEPGVIDATVVESFQPVSTGLYAGVGIVPCSVKYWLSKISRSGSLPGLGDDLESTPATDEDQADIDALDRSVLGFERPADHRWWRGGTPARCYRRDDRLVAYAYIDDHYIGPALADTEATLCAVVADIVAGADDPSAMVINLCANSSALFRMLLRAGARIDDSTPYRLVYCSSVGPLPPSYIHHSDWLP